MEVGGNYNPAPQEKEVVMTKHDKRSRDEPEKEMYEHKIKSKFQSAKQAIAVSLDKARRKGVAPRSGQRHK